MLYFCIYGFCMVMGVKHGLYEVELQPARLSRTAEYTKWDLKRSEEVSEKLKSGANVGLHL
jgi:hypothetical protein